MNNHVVGVFGKRFQIPARGTQVASIVFRFCVAMYLMVSAALVIRAVTSIPLFILAIVWFIVVGKFTFGDEAPKSILSDKQRQVLGYALLLLGTGYRLAGHASPFVLAIIVLYWGLVLYSKRRARA